MDETTLIFAYGNPSRGDDAIAPLLLERLEKLNLPGIALLSDFQLQVEHALDLQGRERVLFMDASLICSPPFRLTRLVPEWDKSFTSHAMRPEALLHAFRELYGEPPPAWLLEVRGERFDLGEPPSHAAGENMEKAFILLQKLCAETRVEAWYGYS